MYVIGKPGLRKKPSHYFGIGQKLNIRMPTEKGMLCQKKVQIQKVVLLITEGGGRDKLMGRVVAAFRDEPRERTKLRSNRANLS